MGNDNFYTFNEYMKKDNSSLTASMEDYIEMVYRLSAGTGFTRIHELSHALNIQQSSATKMVQRLSQMGYIKYQKYGFLTLEEKGKKIGERLLKRHMITESFMRIIGVPDSALLEVTEKMEHVLSDSTSECFENFVGFINENPEIAAKYEAYKNAKGR